MPLENPVGFGASDFVELALAGFLIVLALVARPWIEPIARRIATKTLWCMLLLCLAPILLRLAMLARHPVPSPEVYDEFGHLLVADTLLHFRLANPVHPLHRFFETFFVLQTPSYASIYPIGQGLALALGRAIFGVSWAGVVLSTGALCGLCYWMLRGWTAPEWALLGGVLAVIEFGPLNSWMNSYWGGSVVGAAGCLVFGALPRLTEEGRARHAAILGWGIGISWLCRPYETVFLVSSAVLFLLPHWRGMARPALACAMALLPFAILSLLQNKQVTGSWTTLPYSASRYQYGVPAAFTWQSNAEPHNALTLEQQMQYKMQTSFRANGPETMRTYIQRFVYRMRFYRFFFLPALYVTLPFFVVALRDRHNVWILATLTIFALGVNFYPFFEAHYLGALTCLFVLVAIRGLQNLWPGAAPLIVFLCFAHFAFFYAASFFAETKLDRRVVMNQELAQKPGAQLVFVRYWPQHHFQDEWVYNAADIDRARVVWARDLGASEDRKLLQYFPNRTAWLLEPDAMPPRLSAYTPEPESRQEIISVPSPVPTPPKPKQQKPEKPPLQFEQVH
jgi:hypothetical protein